MKNKEKDYLLEFRKVFYAISNDKGKDYTSLMQLHPSLDYLLKLAPTIIFVIDYRTMNYLFYSESVKNIVGYGSEDFKKGGVEFALTLIHPDDKQVLVMEILPSIISFLKSVPPETYQDYKFSFNYRLKRKDGEYEYFWQYSTYLEPDAEGKPTINFGIGSNVSPLKKYDRIILTIEKREEGNFTTLEIKSDFGQNIFSKRECEVLKLLHQGLSSITIAEKLCLSEHTVNNHRKNMLQKSGVINTTALINYAIANGYV